MISRMFGHSNRDIISRRRVLHLAVIRLPELNISVCVNLREHCVYLRFYIASYFAACTWHLVASSSCPTILQKRKLKRTHANSTAGCLSRRTSQPRRWQRHRRRRFGSGFSINRNNGSPSKCERRTGERERTAHGWKRERRKGIRFAANEGSVTLTAAALFSFSSRHCARLGSPLPSSRRRPRRRAALATESALRMLFALFAKAITAR